jgi:hypothetical protein
MVNTVEWISNRAPSPSPSQYPTAWDRPPAAATNRRTDGAGRARRPTWPVPARHSPQAKASSRQRRQSRSRLLGCHRLAEVHLSGYPQQGSSSPSENGAGATWLACSPLLRIVFYFPKPHLVPSHRLSLSLQKHRCTVHSALAESKSGIDSLAPPQAVVRSRPCFVHRQISPTRRASVFRGSGSRLPCCVHGSCHAWPIRPLRSEIHPEEPSISRSPRPLAHAPVVLLWFWVSSSFQWPHPCSLGLQGQPRRRRRRCLLYSDLLCFQICSPISVWLLTVIELCYCAIVWTFVVTAMLEVQLDV